MKTLKTNLYVIALILLPCLLNAQSKDSVVNESRYTKKILISPYFNNGWSTFKGNNHPAYFAKPSLGVGLKVDYYPLNFVGISAGVGFQQRGTGVYTPDVIKTIGDPDSTHRLRMRLNCIDIPVELLLRSPRGIKGGGVRPSATVGLVFSKMFEANEFFHSVEDGFHISQDRTNSYYQQEILISSSLGVDIDAGGCILQAHAMAQFGSENVFNDDILYPDYNAKNIVYGIRFRVSF